MVLKYHPDAKLVKQKAKDRYFYFRGDKRTQRQNKKAIEHLIKLCKFYGASADWVLGLGDEEQES